jgi:toxin FitB
VTYLLDTNVVSELRKAKSGKAHPAVTVWAPGVRAGSLYVSVITVLELEMGVLQIERRDPKQGAVMRAWLDGHVLPAFAGRVLPIAQQCARLHVPDRLSERDSMIAATALVHGMTVVTRNVAAFKASGVQIINPWSE